MRLKTGLDIVSNTNYNIANYYLYKSMKNIIGIDQYGRTYHNLGQYPRKELLKRLGYSNASKMYVDKKDGTTKHVGYIVGELWVTLYRLERIEQ